jgi:hypothetical protein
VSRPHISHHANRKAAARAAAALAVWRADYAKRNDVPEAEAPLQDFMTDILHYIAADHLATTKGADRGDAFDHAAHDILESAVNHFRAEWFGED